MKNKSWPGYYYLLLSATGLMNLGSWIYLIALNVFVYRLTESALAIAGLYVVGPLTRIICSLFIGSVIDRLPKKRLMMLASIVRAFIVICMPFMHSLLFVYAFVALANAVGTMAGPSQTYLISKLIKSEHRLTYNSYYSMLSSGAFIIGPSIGGVVLSIASIKVAMWLTAGAFFVSAALVYKIPNVDETFAKKGQSWLHTIKSDYLVVYQFAKTEWLLTKIIGIYTAALMIAHALDSQEITFLFQRLAISEGLYGVVVGITGVGAIVGGFLAAKMANKWSVSKYIKFGLTLTLVCYAVFYSAISLWVALPAFVLLGFFMAFSNSGYATYYQEQIPPELMGRYGSILNLVQSTIVVILTLSIGFLAEQFPIQLVTTVAAVVGVAISVTLFFVHNWGSQAQQKKQLQEKRL